jgi:ABC-type amino acid transport substrate-binding protein
MRRRLLLVLCILAMLAFASVAAGSGAGAKYKVKLDFAAASCSTSCDIDSIVVKRLDDDRTSCQPFVDDSACKWTASAGTKVVLETTADPPFTSHTWGGDCSGTGNCVLIMNANKHVNIFWIAPP